MQNNNIQNPFEVLNRRLTSIEDLLLTLNHKTIPNLLENTTNDSDPQPERLINKKEAAKLLGVSLSTIDNYRRKGILIPKKIHGVVRFRSSEVLKAIDELQKA